jgi:adenine-specific DNA-methyltransferase
MPNGREITAKWSCAPDTFQRYIDENRLYIPKDGAGMPRLRIFLSELEGAIPNTWLDDIASYEEGSREIEQIFGSNAFFISPKPTALIRHLAGIAAGRDDIILDFFAGSGTTAHAVLAMNEHDGGTRQCISIQIPEPTAPGSLPRRQGFETIADICRERILRVLDGMNDRRLAAGRAALSLRSCALQPA